MKKATTYRLTSLSATNILTQILLALISIEFACGILDNLIIGRDFETMFESLKEIFTKHYHVSRMHPDKLLRLYFRALMEVKTIVVSLFGSVGVIGVFVFLKSEQLTTVNYIALGIALIVFLIGVRFLYTGLRKRIQQGIFLHNIFHDTRDSIIELRNMLDGEEPIPKMLKKMDDIGLEIADSTAEYFRQLVGETTIGCSIRIIEDDDQFHTWWRSRNLRHRGKTTEPTPSNVGIGYNIRHVRGELGVYIVNDILTAPEELWKRSKNDNRADIKNVMVAPINGYDVETEKKCCLGLLYISSRDRKFFSWYAEHVMAVSDYLGTILADFKPPERVEF